MLYITGDLHGDYHRLIKMKQEYDLKSDDYLIIAGDFGCIFGLGQSDENKLDMIADLPFTVLFLDGNHECFPKIYSYPEEVWNGGRTHRIRQNIRHLMRGQVFEIEGERIFAMGGGESPDIDIRFDNDTWSKSEIPSADELKEGVKNLENEKFDIDFIVTHEPPQKIKAFLNLKDKENVRFTGLNAYFEEINSSCKFTRWYFGSIHEDKQISPSHIAVYRNLIKLQTGEKVK